MKNYFAHKTAEIDQNCIIGEGTKFGISLILCQNLSWEKNAI